jgi:hypothetical protein
MRPPLKQEDAVMIKPQNFLENCFVVSWLSDRMYTFDQISGMGRIWQGDGVQKAHVR